MVRLSMTTTKKVFEKTFKNKHLVTTNDIAEYLSVSERTSRNYLREMIKVPKNDTASNRPICNKVPVETFAQWLKSKGLLVS